MPFQWKNSREKRLAKKKLRWLRLRNSQVCNLFLLRINLSKIWRHLLTPLEHAASRENKLTDDEEEVKEPRRKHTKKKRHVLFMFGGHT